VDRECDLLIRVKVFSKDIESWERGKADSHCPHDSRRHWLAARNMGLEKRENVQDNLSSRVSRETQRQQESLSNRVCSSGAVVVNEGI
jgi:hypothetical protein